MDRSQICRICLQFSTNYIHINSPYTHGAQHDERSNELESKRICTYFDCLKYCSHIEMDADVDKYYFLCKQCILDLTFTFEFLLKVEKSYKNLQNIGTENFEKYTKTIEVETIDYNNEVHEEATYQCSWCDEMFVSPIALDEHISLNHSDERSEILFHDNIEVCDQSTPNKDDNNSECSEVTLQLNVEDSKDCSRQGSTEKELVIDVNSRMHGSSTSDCNNLDTVEEKSSINEIVEKKKATKLRSQKICAVCQATLQKSDSMRDHVLKHHDKIVKCDQCNFIGKEFKFAIHMRNMHPESEAFKCHICTKSFSSEAYLKAHLKYHKHKKQNAIGNACEICERQFSSKHYLQLHMETHNDRPHYRCNQCDKVYITKAALRYHERLHEGNTLECAECGKEFTRQYEFNVHLSFHKREYRHECEICGQKFTIKSHLRTHMWKHDGFKLKCNECDKLFSSPRALLEHSYVHTEMPYPCNYCNKAYGSKSKYKRHLKSTHDKDVDDEALAKNRNKNKQSLPVQRQKPTLVKVDVLKES